jgi:hypothetical protein
LSGWRPDDPFAPLEPGAAAAAQPTAGGPGLPVPPGIPSASDAGPEPSATLDPGPLPSPAGTPAPVTVPVPDVPPMPPVESTRRLLGASFDLLARSSPEMRPASFYVGLVVLGTVAPLALAAWATIVTDVQRSAFESLVVLGPTYEAWDRFLVWIAGIGFLVALIDSRLVAVSLLGARLVGRPITVRQALARSRAVFWQAVVATVIVGGGSFLIQAAIGAVLGSQGDVDGSIGIVVTLIVTALYGAPFAYLLAGIALGDVPATTALGRSLRVFRARKMAAVVVALSETAAQLLILFGLGAGFDIAFRIADAVGLGPDSGTLGVVLITMGIVIGVFAIGTLVFTVTAISVAPQVVMFVGLTHATFGLDHVRRGGDTDPDVPRPGQRRFRWITRPLIAWMVLGLVGFIAILSILG